MVVMQQILNITNILLQHLFRLPLFIMGVAAGLLSLRGVEYSKHISGILHHLSPWTCSEPLGSSNNEENLNVWANRTDRCSLVLVCLIIYSTVVSTFNLTVRENTFLNPCILIRFLAIIPASLHQRPHPTVLLPSPACCDCWPHKR